MRSLDVDIHALAHFLVTKGTLAADELRDFGWRVWRLNFSIDPVHKKITGQDKQSEDSRRRLSTTVSECGRISDNYQRIRQETEFSSQNLPEQRSMDL